MTKKKTSSIILPTAADVKATPGIAVFDTPISQQIKLLPSNFTQDEIDGATVRIEKQKDEIGKHLAESTEILGHIDLTNTGPLPQLHVPPGQNVVSNTAKSASELTLQGGDRAYEKPGGTDIDDDVVRAAQRTIGTFMRDPEDGFKVEVPLNKSLLKKAELKPKQFAQRKEVEVAFKYNEDESLYNLIDYIGSTYSAHYAKEDGLQTLDVWDALGSSVETCRDTAIKYLMRFGAKQGRNHKDLEKAIHYITLMMYFDKKRG